MTIRIRRAGLVVGLTLLLATVLAGVAWAVTYTGTDGDDYIYTSSDVTPDEVDARGGDDIVLTRGGDDELRGGTGNDTLYGNLGNDDIFGGPGYDKLLGASGSDLLIGGAGKDKLSGGASTSGTDVVFAGRDNDRIKAAEDDRIHCGKGEKDTVEYKPPRSSITIYGDCEIIREFAP